MNKAVLPILIIVLGYGIFIAFKYKLNKDLSHQPVYSPKPTISTPPTITNNPKTLSLFVPYWTLSDNAIETNGFDRIIYFGIKPNKEGINNTQKEEDQLEKFKELLPPDKPKLLALRMTDSSENVRLLDDLPAQRKIVDQTVEKALKNNISGIVLDLEIVAIPFDSLIKQINEFTSMFYSASKKNNLTFTIVVYGDSLYRARPFDIKTLGKNSDTIMIMAYDLHKSKGNPGPNFPLFGRKKFGYDLTQMTNDFLRTINPQKITVIFGLFGYDWLVDENGNATQQAHALTLTQIKQKFLDKCEFESCSIIRDKEAAEIQIRYTDYENKKHIIWFEDMESVKNKQNYLLQKGITSFSYWAYSYF